jgi:hypothetical protein
MLSCNYLHDSRLDDRKLGIPWRDRMPARPGAMAGSQRHFSLVKVSLWLQSQPPKGYHLENVARKAVAVSERRCNEYLAT